MVAPACVIDCSNEAAANANFLLTRTDWSKRSPRDYANLKEDGAHTPGPDAEVMQWLVEQRGIIGFGTETIGTDAGQGSHFEPPHPAHHFLHGAGRYGSSACATSTSCLPPGPS